MPGIGLEWGSESVSPRCSLLSRTPASSLASGEKGGVLTSPRSHISGLSSGIIHNTYYVISDIEARSLVVTIQVFLFIAIYNREQKLVSDPPPLLIAGQDRGCFLIERHYTTIFIMVLTVTKADPISQLQPAASKRLRLWGNGPDVSIHSVDINGTEFDLADSSLWSRPA